MLGTQVIGGFICNFTVILVSHVILYTPNTTTLSTQVSGACTRYMIAIARSHIPSELTVPYTRHRAASIEKHNKHTGV